MTTAHEIVFLIDVENTLLNNDRVLDDLLLHIEREFGSAERSRYLAIFEELRAELGYAPRPIAATLNDFVRWAR